MNDLEERRHANGVRWKARATWPVLVAGLMLVRGPAGIVGDARIWVVALMLGAVAALNLPSLDVIRRAVREGAPRGPVVALGAGLAMRLVASVLLAGLLLRA